MINIVEAPRSLKPTAAAAVLAVLGLVAFTAIQMQDAELSAMQKCVAAQTWQSSCESWKTCLDLAEPGEDLIPYGRSQIEPGRRACATRACRLSA